MIEILVIIAVVKAFGKKAEEKNLNKSAWKWIGGLSYYIPILLMSFAILPVLVNNGTFNFTSQTEITITFIVINLATGILCCAAAYAYLSNQPNNIPPSNPDVLDEEWVK